ncbi:EAL and GGDEF domain-containing protein [Thiococcus pfennigii]|uniref:sensor domain-containing protein n=1 Tax=Thiococcus pfennigii TaxID=1057 RepID=UPI001903A534|nr:EAL domain-containing protein [Thiococcus pfennigii]MBK1700762.1 hypothetical protein [Thiococcus pfennigii]
MLLTGRDLVEQSPVATFVIDTEHRVAEWNRACARLTGVSAAAMIGTRDQWRPFYPEARPLLADLVIAGATAGELRRWYGEGLRGSQDDGSCEAEGFFPHLHGGGRWILFRAAPLHGPDGRPIGAIQVLQDVTDQKRAETDILASQRQLSEIIQGSPVPIFVLDVEHRVTHWNRACEVVMGIPANTMIGTRDQWRAFYAEARPVMADLVLDGAASTDFAQYYADCRPSAFIDGAYEAEGHFPQFPHGGRWLAFTAAPLRGLHGETIGAIETLQDITERKRAELARAETERQLSEERFRVLFSEMINGFALHEILLDDAGRPCDYRFLAVNPAFEAMTGLCAADVVGRRVLEVMPATEGEWIARYGRVALTGEPDTFESYSRAIDKHFEVRAFRPAPGQFAVTFQDITARKRAETRLKLIASVFEHTQEGIVITDPNARIIDVNDAFVRITGYDRAELIGLTPAVLKSGRHGPDFYRAMWLSLREEGVWRGEIWNRRKNGDLYPEQLTISAVVDDQGATSHYVGIITDITALKRHEAELERIAHFDVLTGLPNRMLLQDRLHQAIARAERGQSRLAVCFLDVDGFKPINDRYGHDAGDRLLIELAERFRAELRGNDTVARLGGDEFVILLTDLSDEAACVEILERLLAAVARPLNVAGQSVSVTASIGVTLFSDRSVDSDTLIRQADQAMYRSKQLGKNTFFFYDDRQDIALFERQKAIRRIERALADSELVLHYQPKVDMRRGQVIGAEALIRWHHPERGLLPPAEFLPLIEDSDLIVAIGDWVMDEALRQLAEWRTEGLRIAVSINVAARHLQRPSFGAELAAKLGRSGLAGGACLEIEITETAAIADMAHVGKLIEDCRRLGVHSALDDFGTGYSSLTYLKLLPVTALKIDKSFIRDMLEDAEDRAIVTGVIGLAKAFDRAVIAEGVETVAHGLDLLALGCDLAQGFGIAPPMSAERLPDWVRHWRPDPAWAAAPPSPDAPLLAIRDQCRTRAAPGEDMAASP